MFKEIPAKGRSIYGRKLVQGLGTSDSTYQVRLKIDGKVLYCPYYRSWLGSASPSLGELV